jgi:3-deoxy-D-manno-octulosonate 8-phosphate phosphatase (KDO 8-P phosphatase)
MHTAHVHWFKTMLANQALVDRLRDIKLVVADIDGSLTDGTVHYNAVGEADRMYSPQDGYATRMAMDQGLMVAFLSGNAGASITSRAQKLNIPTNFVILGSKDKRIAVKQLQAQTHTTAAQTLVFGDDYLDAAVKEANAAITLAMPHNALFYLKPLADCVIPLNAGRGSAFRLLLDLVLFIQNKHIAQHLIKQALEAADEKNSACCSCSA